MFINALMLAGVAGAAVPLVLHLLSRARYRTVDWGAMMFLLDVRARQQQTARLKQLILLLVRMTIVALLAVALARPVVTGRWGALATEGRVTAAIVLDRSASMAFDEGGRKRFDAAREAALQVLSVLKKEDQAALLLSGDGRPVGAVRFTSDLQSIAAQVADAQPAHGMADLAEAITAAVDALDKQRSADRQLFVICDRQATSWRGLEGEIAAALGRRVRNAESPIRFHVLPVGGEVADNVAVESIALTNPPAIRGCTAEVEITVRNHGVLPRSGLPLVLRSSSGPAPISATLNLAPGAASTVRLPIEFAQAGPQVLTAEVSSPGLQTDDRLEYVLDVVDPVKVLVISGDEQPEGAFRGESDFVRLALMPYTQLHRQGPEPAVVEVVPIAQWRRPDLSSRQVLVLANVPELTPQQVRAVEQFVYGGGGLLVAPGAQTRTDSYNRSLHREGAGVLPAMLLSPVAGDGSQTTSLLGLDLAHPVFRFLRGRPNPIPSATITRYLPAKPSDTGARVLGTYASGAPFVVEATSGRGRVLLVTTPLDADWSTLPLTNFYLPFVQSAVRYLAAGAMVDRNLEPGQEIRAAYEPGVEVRRAAIRRPDGREVLDVVSFRGRAEVRYDQTDVPGTYTLRARLREKDKPETDQTVQYVVHAPKQESDLTPLPEQRWQELSEAMGFVRIDTQKQSVASVLSASRSGRELWLALVGLTMALAVLEMGLARLWSSEGR
jgi:hypothetical protein